MRDGLALALIFTACGGTTSTNAAHVGDSTGGAPGTSDAGRDAVTRACMFKGFARAALYRVANEPVTIVAIDRTRDGHLDLLVGERPLIGDSSELFVNQGDGSFKAATNYGASANFVGNLVAADFDGDGRLDLVSQANRGQEVDPPDASTGFFGIDFGTRDGFFASSLVATPTPRVDGNFAVNDFNGDGHADLAFAGYHYVWSGGVVTSDGGIIGISLRIPEPADPMLGVFLNRGDGTFGAPATYANQDFPYRDFRAGDFDGDGHVDLAELSTRGPGGFGVFFNVGDGTFGDEVGSVASQTWGPYGLVVADFDGDGKDDVATTTIVDANLPSEAMVLEIFTGRGDRSFNGPRSYPIPAVPDLSNFVGGDFNGDGRPDVAMALKSQWSVASPIPIAVFENLGAATFGAPRNYDVGGQAFQLVTAITAGDFNADGVTDIAVTTSGTGSTPDPTSVSVLLSQCE